MNVELDKVLTIVRTFVARKRGASADAITADTPLLRGGCLDSFQLVELIAELERDLGEAIPEGMLIPEDFESPAVLHARLSEI